MLKVTNLTKEYNSGDNKVFAVQGINLDIAEGKFVSIIGKSGSGKTTLLSLLGSLDKATSGNIVIDGKDISSMKDHDLVVYRRKKIGFVFQSYNLISNLTAVENVMLPMLFNHVSADIRKTRALELLDQVGISKEKQNRKPSKLSGGEQQRVAIARALVNNPKIILADEPTGNLDSDTGEMIFGLLHDLSKKKNTTIVVVTHDLSIAGKTDMAFKMSDGHLV